MNRRLTTDQRIFMAGKLMNLANLLSGGLIVILLLDKTQAPYAVATGLVIFTGLYMFAFWLMQEEKK